jgi:hypothetical protein
VNEPNPGVSRRGVASRNALRGVTARLPTDTLRVLSRTDLPARLRARIVMFLSRAGVRLVSCKGLCERLPQRPHPRNRHQTLSSPHRWRPGPRLRKPRPQSRSRTHHDDLRRRTKLTDRTRPRPPRILDSHPRHRHRNPADIVQATVDPSDCMATG